MTSIVIHHFLYVCLPEQLVAGSGANQDKDEVADGTQLEGAESQEVRTDVNAKEDGYNVGVPGPLTRIFIIANRGVANLVQDLILVSITCFSDMLGIYFIRVHCTVYTKAQTQ